MNRIQGFIYILILATFFACQKNSGRVQLPAGGVTIEALAQSDTLVKEVGVIKDSLVTIHLRAMLNAEASGQDHYVNFAIDTSYFTSFKAKYGNALLLPMSAYLFFRSQCRIPAGSRFSEPIELNLHSQTSLVPETTYVLPLVIKSVDGDQNAATSNEVLYLVVKSGQSPNVSKTGWSIVGFSSQITAAYSPNLILDNDDINTYWWTALQPMPQWVVIDFGKAETFQSVTSRSPATAYTTGGHPKKIKLEVSTDGVLWVDKGTYDGATTNILWEQNIGTTTARYLRFTVLEVKLFGGVETLMISGIGLIR